MSKKPASSNGATKSDAIRAVLSRQPRANNKAIQSALSEKGVKASDALINKIKYGRGGGKKKRAGVKSGAHGSKAEAIRATLARLGAKARNRDIVADLAKRGVKVSSAQVSNLRKKQRGRGRHATTTIYSVSLEHLLAAKTLVERLGGIDVARQALNDLSKLLPV